MWFTLATESDLKSINLCAAVHGLRQFALDALTVVCDADKVYMQGLDNSHVCLFEVELHSSWFDEYNYEVVIDKKYLSKKILDLFKKKAKELPPWDPMGALASK